MKFRYVKFKNFLPYGDEIQTVELDEPGIKLVLGENKKDGGSNGSGKSSAVVDSIVYALFGQTTKNLKADQVVNNINDKDCYVELGFDIGNDQYVIKRYRKHTEHNNALFIEKNGKDITEDNKRGTQNYLEDIIKISYKSFVSSIVLSTEKIENFAEADPLERKKIIENLLMYDFISKYHKSTKEILRIIGPEISSIEASIKEKKETVDTLSANLLKYIEHMENEEKNKSTKINLLQESIEEWKSFDPNQELTIKKEIEENSKELKKFKQETEDYRKTISSRNKNLVSYKEKLQLKQKEIENVVMNPKECPVCHSKEITSDTISGYLGKLRQEKYEIENSILDIEKEISTLEERSNTNLIKITELEQRIDSLKESCKTDLSIEEIKNIKNKIVEAESEIRILSERKFDPENDSYIASTYEQIKKCKIELKKSKKKLKELSEEKEYYEWWKNALSNSPSSLKSFCINHVLLSLNKYIDYYLGFFSFDVKFSLNEELESTIIKDGKEVTQGSLSSGEKRALELSLVFALYEVIRLKMPDNINVIILDELLSTFLDDVRVTGALDILCELEERGLTVFVIDHKSFLKDNLDCKIITVVKEEDGTSSVKTTANWKDKYDGQLNDQ